MPTIKDIAALAGVSHGTVSNVLNKRGNVSAEKIELVENAAKELGFKLNAQAKQLRQGHSKKAAILVPRINLKRYSDLFIGISNTLKEEGYEVNIYYSDNLIYYEKALLERVISSNPAIVVVISSYLKNPGIFNEETKFIFVERYVENMPKKSLFVTFDFERAGYELASQCVEDGGKNIAILCGDEKYSNNKSFLKGVTEVLEQGNCLHRVYIADDTMKFIAAFNIINSKDNFNAIITVDIETAEYFRMIQGYDPHKALPVIYVLTSTDVGPTPGIVKYELNYKLLGRRLAKYIVKTERNEILPKDYLVLPEGTFQSPMEAISDIKTTKDLNILMLSSPTSEALRLLLPSFTLTTGIKVNLIEVTYEELYKSAADNAGSPVYDLMRLDMAWLSELGEKLFMPIDLDSKRFENIRDLLSPGLPDDYYKIGDTVYSLPFDPSVQILYYRKDLFQDALIKREFYERYKRQLAVPGTFEEYNETAAFFTKRLNPKSPTNYGTTLTFGSSAVAACDFLPRLKAMGAGIIDAAGRAVLDSPLLKTALEKYLEAYQYTDQSTNLWWQKTMESFAEGNVAMNIVFSNYASSMLNKKNSNVVGKIGFAPVPGGCPMLGGGIIGIARNSKKPDEAAQFLRWVYGDKIASAITYLGGYINNKTLLNNVDILELYPWIEGMEHAFSIGWRRNCSRYGKPITEFKYEEILGTAIRSSVLGIMSMEDALKEAQKRCDSILN
jgi:multiple sugar transport system substrate-binding protein